MEIDEHHNVSIRGKQLEVQAITPLVSEWHLRATMHDELHGIFLAGIKVRRLDQPTLDLVPLCAAEPERFEGDIETWERIVSFM